MKNQLMIVAVGLCATGASSQGVPDAYTIVELAPLVSGTSEIAAVNNTGFSVGWSATGGVDTAVVWTPDGVAVDLGVAPNFDESRAIDINDEGAILYYAEEQGEKRWFVRSPVGVHQELLPPVDHEIWKVVAINSAGDAIGTTLQVLDDFEHIVSVWELTPSGYVGAPVLDLNGMNGWSINDSGVLTAANAFSGGTGYLHDQRSGVTTSHSAGGQFYDIVDINNAGKWVYLFENDSAGVSAAVFGEDTILPFGCENATQSLIFCIETGTVFGWAINERGVVVGTSSHVDFDDGGFPISGSDPDEAFVWTAETGTLALESLVVEGDLAQWGVLSEALDINDSGWVVGNGKVGAQKRAFLLVPREACAGDVNHDGEVTPTDFTAWINAFNSGCD